MNRFERGATALTAATVVAAGGYLAHDPVERFLDAGDNPADHNLMLGNVSEAGEGIGEITLDQYGRSIGATILSHIPEEMNCANSCDAGTMHTTEPETNEPVHKYEVFVMGKRSTVVDLIATKHTPSVEQVDGSATLIHYEDSAGVSVVFDFAEADAMNSIMKKRQANKPVTPEDYQGLLADPKTNIAFIDVGDSANRFAKLLDGSLNRQGDDIVSLEWGVLGPEDVRNVDEHDRRFQPLLNQFVVAADGALSEVAYVEKNTQQD